MSTVHAPTRALSASRRCDVAIYIPFAGPEFVRDAVETNGGAERQMRLLADELAGRGQSVAAIVYPLEADPLSTPQLRVVQRAERSDRPGASAKAEEARHVWAAMAAADARVYVFRMSSPALGLGAMFCKARGRRLVFSSANDFDFTFETLPQDITLRLYRLGVRWADAVVVQSTRQVELAREAFPRLRRLIEIPSFAAPGTPSRERPEHFLWMSRCMEYKRPLEYVALARELPEARFSMILVRSPNYDDGLDAEVRRQAGELDNFELLEARPRPEAMKLVERSVAVVNTSRLEGMPNVFLEGWARGIPALSLEFDPDQRIATRRLGVAAAGDWQRFVDGARALWHGLDDRADLAERCVDYVNSIHSPPVVAERWSRMLAEL